MGYLSKRRGAISIFLLIVFMITYVFMGLLVDAGRYRMAQTYMESALDNASSSVLSNYNQLLFDLYGLFSVDTKLEEGQSLEDAIYEKYNHYLKETLNIVDASEYETMLTGLIQNATSEDAKNAESLQDFVAVLTKEKDKISMSTASLYDFQTTELKAGTSITLADPANVESQIIEYMKFRAPVALTKDMEGFLRKMQAIVEMKDRIAMAIKKEQIKDKYESKNNGNVPLSTQAADLLNDINSYAGTLYHYTVTPHKEYGELQSYAAPTSTTVYSSNPQYIKDYIKTFDTALDSAETAYNEAVRSENQRHASKLKSLLTTLQNKMIEEAENLAKEAEEKADDETDAENTQEEESPLVELSLSNSYTKKDSNNENSCLFTEIVFPTTLEQLEDLSTEVFGKVSGETDSWCTSYVRNYRSEISKHDDNLTAAETTYKTSLANAKTELTNKINNMEDNAQNLYETARNLVSRIQTTVTRYESYAAELKAEQGDGSDANKVSVYATEIELAEANMGELLKNLDLLANSRAYLDDLGYGIKDTSGTRKCLSDDLINLAEAIVGNWEVNPGKNNSGTKTPLEDLCQGNDRYKDASAAVSLYKEGYSAATIPLLSTSAEVVKNLLPEIQNHMCVLYSHVSYFHAGHYRKDPDVIVGEEVKAKTVKSGDDQKKAEEKAKSKEEVKETLTTEEGKTLVLDSAKVKENPEMLKVAYSYTEENAEEFSAEVSVDGEVTADTLINILNVGQNLIAKLGDLLEEARDNLYVDAYVMSMFPNYKDHYKGYDKAKGTSILSEDREKYLASYAEVEFIVTGAGANGSTVVADKVFAEGADGFGNMSVWSMRTRLFGTRMLFNSISMLTDSAKLQQASVLSAWAGPFAPLVSAVLVICWIVAETVLDVMILMGDVELEGYAKEGKLPIFKQSGDWLFSLNGVAESLIGLAVDELSKNILEKATQLVDTAEQKANVMIYKAYSNANSVLDNAGAAVDMAVTAGQEDLTKWSSELAANITKAVNDDGTVSGTVQGQLNSMTGQLSTISGELSNVAAEKDALISSAKTVTEDAKEQAVLAVSRMSDTVMQKTKEYVNHASQGAKEFVGKNIQKVVPIGTVANSSNASVEMGYTDYLYFFLFIMNQETKVKRIQAVIQANLQVGGQESFQLENAPVAVWADLECSMKYMFLSDSIVPEGMKKNGRLRLKVISAQSY